MDKPNNTGSDKRPMPLMPDLKPAVPSNNPTQDAAEAMNQAYLKLEKGNFGGALSDIENTLKIFGIYDTIIVYLIGKLPNAQSLKRELGVCARYKLLLTLLLQIKHETQPKQISLLTRILGEIAVQPKHRLVCVRMAISRNMEAKNFKTAARLIKVILNFIIFETSFRFFFR
jgi:hypothetical protein